MKTKYLIGLILCMFIVGSSWACGYDSELEVIDKDDLTEDGPTNLLKKYTPCGGDWWDKKYKCNGDTID